MRVFLDANVLVSVLNKEYPLFTYSSRLLSLIGDTKFELYTSPICLAIAFYFSEKKSGAKRAKEKIELLSGKMEIAPTDKSIVLKALQDKSVLDFEDGLEYYSARSVKCKCIITENVSDFHFSGIEVLQTHVFLEKYVLQTS